MTASAVTLDGQNFPSPQEAQVYQPPANHWQAVQVLTSAQPSGSQQPQALRVDFDWEMQVQASVEVNPQIEIPSFNLQVDLDLFNQMLEQEPIPEPTDAELAAHAFLRKVLGK